MQTTLLREDIRSHKEISQSPDTSRYDEFQLRRSAKSPAKDELSLKGTNRSPSVSRNTFDT
jgi:hypothetical protein